MKLSRINETDEHHSSSKDSEECGDDEYDSKDEEEEVPSTNVGAQQHHVPKVSWF